MKKVSRVLDLRKNNQNSFTGVPKTDISTYQLEFSDKHAAAATWSVTFDIGR